MLDADRSPNMQSAFLPELHRWISKFRSWISRMVRWCIRLTRLTLVCEVIRYRLVQVRQNQKNTFRVGGPQAPFSISSSFILSFVLLPFFLNTKNEYFVWATPLMASTISVLGEPERVNLVVRALNPDYLLLDIFLHLRSETWTQWTIEAARVKVHHRPYSLRMVRWCIRLTRLTLVCEVIRYRLVQVRQNQKKKKKISKLTARHLHACPPGDLSITMVKETVIL